MLMHAIAHGGCTDTVRESKLKVNPLRQVCVYVRVCVCALGCVCVCGCGCRFGGADGCIPLTMLVDVCQSWTYI